MNVNYNRINLGESAPLESPLLLFFELSGFCNFACKFCPHGTKDDLLKKDNMAYELFQKAIDELCVNQMHISKIRYCGMGEMLVNPRALDIISYAGRKRNNGGLSVKCLELVTNGYLFKNLDALKLCESLDRIVISIEGLNEAEYEEITGKKIDYNDLVSGIKKVYKARGNCEIICKIQSNAIKNKEDLERFEKIFGDITDVISVENIADMWPDYDTKYVDKNKNFRYDIEEKKGNIKEKEVCVQIFKSLQIFANGDVVPCCFDWERKNILGNINECSISEIWKGEKLKKLYLRHLNLEKGEFEPCKNCRGNDYCDVDDIDCYRTDILERIRK